MPPKRGRSKSKAKAPFVAYRDLKPKTQEFLNKVERFKCQPRLNCNRNNVYCREDLVPYVEDIYGKGFSNLSRSKLCDLLFEYKDLNREILNAKKRERDAKSNLKSKMNEKDDLVKAVKSLKTSKKDITDVTSKIDQLSKELAIIKRQTKNSTPKEKTGQLLVGKGQAIEDALDQLRMKATDIALQPTPLDVSIGYQEERVRDGEERISALEKELAESREARNELQARLAVESGVDHDKEIIQLRNRLDGMIADKENIEFELGDLARQKEIVETNLRVKEFHRANKPSEEEKLRRELHAKEDALDALRAGRKRRSERSYILQLNRHKRMIQEKEDALEQSEHKIRILRRQIQKNQKTNTEIVASLETDLQDELTHKNDAVAELQLARSELEQARQKLSSSERKYEAVYNDLRRAQFSLQQLERYRSEAGTAQELSRMNNELQRKLQDIESKMVSVNAEKDSALITFNQQMTDIEFAKAEKTRLEGDLSLANKRISEISQELNGLKRSTATDSSELSRLKAQKTTDDKKINDLGSGLRDAKAELTKMKTDEGQLRKALTDKVIDDIINYAGQNPKHAAVTIASLRKYQRIREDLSLMAKSFTEFLEKTMPSAAKDPKLSAKIIKAGKAIIAGIKAERKKDFANDSKYKSTLYGADPYEFEDSDDDEDIMSELKEFNAEGLTSKSVLDAVIAKVNEEAESFMTKTKDGEQLISEINATVKQIASATQKEPEEVENIEQARIVLSSLPQMIVEMREEINGLKSANKESAQKLAAVNQELDNEKSKPPPTPTAPKPAPITQCDKEIAELKTIVTDLEDLSDMYQKKIEYLITKTSQIRLDKTRSDVNKNRKDFENALEFLKSVKQGNVTFNEAAELARTKNPNCNKIVSSLSQMKKATEDFDENVKNEVLRLYEDAVGIGRVYVRMFGNIGKNSGGDEFARPRLEKGSRDLVDDAGFIDAKKLLSQGNNLEKDGTFGSEFLEIAKNRDYVGRRYGPFTGVFHNTLKTYAPRFGKDKPRETNNLTVYENSIQSMIKNNMEAGEKGQEMHDVVIIAYGQSGSGKTVSLQGGGDEKDKQGRYKFTEENRPGLIYYCLNDIIEGGNLSKLEVASYQLYPEFAKSGLIPEKSVIYEVLRKKTEERVKIYGSRDGDGNIIADAKTSFNESDFGKVLGTGNLKFSDIKSEILGSSDRKAAVFNLLTELANGRPARATLLNDDSSRSHLFTIFNVRLDNGKSFKFTAIDLGGNEKARPGSNLGNEGVMINASLTFIMEFLRKYAVGEDVRDINRFDFNSEESRLKTLMAYKPMYTNLLHMLGKAMRLEQNTDVLTKVSLFLHIRSHMNPVDSETSRTGGESVNFTIVNSTSESVKFSGVGSPGTLEFGSIILDNKTVIPPKGGRGKDVINWGKNGGYFSKKDDDDKPQTPRAPKPGKN